MCDKAEGHASICTAVAAAPSALQLLYNDTMIAPQPPRKATSTSTAASSTPRPLHKTTSATSRPSCKVAASTAAAALTMALQPPRRLCSCYCHHSSPTFSQGRYRYLFNCRR
ncbi:hypothetical protein ACLOJK_035147 [Asimina triloba]